MLATVEFKSTDKAFFLNTAKRMGWTVTLNASASVSEPATKGKKQSATSKTTKATKADKYAPKNDTWKAYKAARQAWLDDNGYSYAEVGWMPREEFEKAAKPWTEKYGAYVKKADRK